MDNTTLQRMHFDSLRMKYKVADSRTAASDNFLYLILRKADLGMQVTDIELQWLAENRLFNCIEFISLQQYKAEEEKRLETELIQIRAKYRIPQNVELPISSSIFSILWKLETGHTLGNSDFELKRS